MGCFAHVPAVSYAAAVASHSQAFLQVRGKAWGSNAPAAVGTHTLFVFPLVVHLAKDIQARLVHNFWKFTARGFKPYGVKMEFPRNSKYTITSPWPCVVLSIIIQQSNKYTFPLCQGDEDRWGDDQSHPALPPGCNRSLLMQTTIYLNAFLLVGATDLYTSKVSDKRRVSSHKPSHFGKVNSAMWGLFIP